MARTYGGALRRAQELAGDAQPPSRHNHNHEHNNSMDVMDGESKIHRILNPHSQSVSHNHNHKVGETPKGEKQGPPRKGKVSLTRLVNSDPTFRQAMALWGIRGNALNYHCQRLGIHRTRRLLQNLMTWQPRFWEQMHNPAGYVAVCLSNAPVDANTIAKTKEYEQWCRSHGLEG